jgi:hypothetical protein
VGTPATPVTPATPIAGTSYDFAANVCAAKWYSGSGELPCPGTNGDAKGFVLITSPSKLENGTTDNRSGLITFPQNINNGYIQGIYPVYKVKAGDKFRATVNCESGATSCFVVFRLDYSLDGSSSVQTFWAFVEKYEGGVYSADIDLGALTGKDVKFILTVLSSGSPVGDRALWVGPIPRLHLANCNKHTDANNHHDPYGNGNGDLQQPRPQAPQQHHNLPNIKVPAVERQRNYIVNRLFLITLYPDLFPQAVILLTIFSKFNYL